MRSLMIISLLLPAALCCPFGCVCPAGVPVCAEFVPSTPVFGSVVTMQALDIAEGTVAAATALLACGNCTRDVVGLAPPDEITFLVLSLEPFETPMCILPCLNVTVHANALLRYNASVSRQDVASQVMASFESPGERLLSKTDIAAIVSVGGGAVLLVASGVGARWYRNRKMMADAAKAGNNPFNDQP